MTAPDNLDDLHVSPARLMTSTLAVQAEMSRILSNIIDFASDLADSADIVPVVLRKQVAQQIMNLVSVPEKSEPDYKSLLYKLAAYTDSLVDATMMVQMDQELAAMHREISAEVTAALGDDLPDSPGPSFTTLDLAQRAYQAAGVAYCRANFNYTPDSYVQGQAGADKHVNNDAQGMVRENWFRAVVDAVLNVALAKEPS